MELKWGAPPVGRTGVKGKYAEVLDELAKRPGDWAMISTMAAKTGSGSMANCVKAAAMKAGVKVEMTTRLSADKTTRSLYARVVA